MRLAEAALGLRRAAAWTALVILLVATTQRMSGLAGELRLAGQLVADICAPH